MALTLTVNEFEAFAKKVSKDPKLFFITPSLMKQPLKNSKAPLKYFKEDYAAISQYIKTSKFLYIIPSNSSSYEAILHRLNMKYKAAKRRPTNVQRPVKELLTAFCRRIAVDKVSAFRKSRDWVNYKKLLLTFDITTTVPDTHTNTNKNKNKHVSDDESSDNDDDHVTDDGNDITLDAAFDLSQHPEFGVTGSKSQRSQTNTIDVKEEEDEHESDVKKSGETVSTPTANRHRQQQSASPQTSRSLEILETQSTNADFDADNPLYTVDPSGFTINDNQTKSALDLDCDPFVIHHQDPPANRFDAISKLNSYLRKNVTYSILSNRQFKFFHDQRVRDKALKVHNLLRHRAKAVKEKKPTANAVNLYYTSRIFFANLVSNMAEMREAGKTLSETLRCYNEERRIGFIAFLDNILMTGISINMLYSMQYNQLYIDPSRSADKRSVIDLLYTIFFNRAYQRSHIKEFWWRWLIPKLLERASHLQKDKVLDAKYNQLKKWNHPYFKNRLISESVKYFRKRSAAHMIPFDDGHERNSHGLKRKKEFHRTILSNSPPSPLLSDKSEQSANPFMDCDIPDNTNNLLQEQRAVFDGKIDKVTNEMNARMDRMAHNLRRSDNRYLFSQHDSPKKKLITLQSHAISALTVDRTTDKEAAIFLAETVAKEENRTHQQIIMEVMQRKMNGNKRADTASNKELVTKVEGHFILFVVLF